MVGRIVREVLRINEVLQIKSFMRWINEVEFVYPLLDEIE